MSLVHIQSRKRCAWLAWSGGKNALLALQVTRERDLARLEGLITFVDSSDALLGNRVPIALVEEQARSVGLPLCIVEVERSSPSLSELRKTGVSRLIFGDLRGSPTLEGHRSIAEEAGLEPIFPFGEEPPAEMAHKVLAAQIRSVLTVVDHTRAPRAWIGRTFSESLLAELPEGVDPVGAQGEFHTFACGGSMMTRPVSPRWIDLEHTETLAIARLTQGSPRGYGHRPSV